jgi:hypothetical protein
MFRFKYINRHYFLEHEGKLYLVDTGCPKSFGINGYVPWTDKTPQAVILDMPTKTIRFHRLEKEFFIARGRIKFTAAPGTRAPILEAYHESQRFNVIWDTGAQLGYAIGLQNLSTKNKLRAMGPFKDFSPIYGEIESVETRDLNFNIMTIDFFDHGVITVRTQTADAPPRIAQDLRKEGADAVLGNDWMHRDDAIIAITARRSEIHIKGGGHLYDSWDHLRVFEDPPRKWRKRVNIFDIVSDEQAAISSEPTVPPRDPFDDVQLERLPVGAEATGLRPSLRQVPTQLGPFTVDHLRAHLGMDNIDGIIGNDLLLDTVL